MVEFIYVRAYFVNHTLIIFWKTEDAAGRQLMKEEYAWRRNAIEAAESSVMRRRDATHLYINSSIRPGLVDYLTDGHRQATTMSNVNFKFKPNDRRPGKHQIDRNMQIGSQRASGRHHMSDRPCARSAGVTEGPITTTNYATNGTHLDARRLAGSVGPERRTTIGGLPIVAP